MLVNRVCFKKERFIGNGIIYIFSYVPTVPTYTFTVNVVLHKAKIIQLFAIKFLMGIHNMHTYK